MKLFLNLAFAAAVLLNSLPARANLNIFACEPEWASLAQELGGDKVSVFAATTAQQDPHRIEARPSLIARMRQADLVLCAGSELEIGWLPLLLTQSGNARVQRGTPGYLETSQLVPRLEIPTVLDRSLGDIHPSGNPHVHLDPRNMVTIAQAVSERLAKLDPASVETYRVRGSAFQERWRAAMQRWERAAAALKGVPVVVYHRDMSYFIAWTGMREAGSLEPKPGVPPTPGHLAEIVERMKASPAKAVVYSPYNNPAAARFLSERTGVPAVALPFTVGGSDKAKDLFGLFDDMIDRLAKAAK